jgi:Amidase
LLIFCIVFVIFQAALLASGGSVVGLASDVGGSARLPAAFTGVYGHKPSPGEFLFFNSKNTFSRPSF